MKLHASRRKFLATLAATVAWWLTPAFGQKQRKKGGPNRLTESAQYCLPPELDEFASISVILGRPSNRAVTASVLSRELLEGYLEYGGSPGQYSHKSSLLRFESGQPLEWKFEGLQPDTEYFYRLQFRKPGAAGFQTRPESRFHTQRAAGKTFTFGIQGDSHPERPQMSDPGLYARTLLMAAAGKPDFYICMGDDFSVDKLEAINAESVTEPYRLQRPFLGLVGESAPVFLVNGNHEQASRFNYNQRDVRHELALGVQRARNSFYPTPAPDGFYTGNPEQLEGIGLLKDYCAWSWGDALFVILDNYWQSPGQVDSGFQDRESGKKNRDWWGITLGDEQYQWFKRTLEQSKAKYKFVFAHHVLGTGRGGIEECDLYEWGGKNKRGESEFSQKRPRWELPIHQLMAKHGVTIFFQGHDHLYARQERDGIVYQEVPMPADPFYNAHNQERYQSGTKLPNSGYLRVTVSPVKVKVDYLRSYLPKDETASVKTGQVAFSYSIPAE